MCISTIPEQPIGLLQDKMARVKCPIPKVEEALEPYIHTRQETTAIRQTLTEHLRGQLVDEIPVSNLSITTPAPSLDVKNESIAQDGLYKQYLEALAAHRHAQEQYMAVKAEIETVRRQQEQQSRAGKDNTRTGESPGLQEYIELLRKRRQANQLEIIHGALRQLTENPSSRQRDTKSLLRERLGDPPQPPVTGVDHQADISSKVEALVFRLKKDVLVAKSSLDGAQAAKTEAEQRPKALPEPSTAAQVAALRTARDALIAWVEGELAKVPEDDGDTSDAALDAYVSGDGQGEISSDAVATQVHELYDLYVETRRTLTQQLVVAVAQSRARREAQARQHDATTTGAEAAGSNPASATGSKQAISASALLPYAPLLLSALRAESLLLQQTSHLRRQIALNDEETLRTIQRLAGESYLVPADATSMLPWAQAADEATRKTAVFVREQVAAGEESVEGARRALGRMRARREALRGLKGDVGIA